VFLEKIDDIIVSICSGLKICEKLCLAGLGSVGCKVRGGQVLMEFVFNVQGTL